MSKIIEKACRHLKVDEIITINALVNDINKISHYIMGRLNDYPSLNLHEKGTTRFLDNKFMIDSEITRLTHTLLNNKLKVLNTLVYDIQTNYGLILINVDELEHKDSVRVYLSEWACDLDTTKQEMMERYGKIHDLTIMVDPDYESILEFQFHYNDNEENGNDTVTPCNCNKSLKEDINECAGDDLLKKLLQDIRLQNKILYKVNMADDMDEDFMRLNRDYLITVNTFLDLMEERLQEEYNIKTNYIISIRDNISFYVHDEYITNKELLMGAMREEYHDWYDINIQGIDDGIQFNINLKSDKNI